MTIRLVNRGTQGELIVEGRLDSVTSPEADEIFRQTAERFDTVILNIADMEYVSSAGLRVLKQLHIFMKKKNGTLLFKNPTKSVMDVFEMTGFVGLFTFI